MVRGRRRVVALGVAAALVPVLAGCADRSVPTLLDKDDFPGAVEATHGTSGWNVAGQGWCGYLPIDLVDGIQRNDSYSSIRLDEDGGSWAGAQLAWAGPYVPAEDVIDAIARQAQDCIDHVAEVGGRRSVEPLIGLDDGVLGWHVEETSSHDGQTVWGEYVVIPVSPQRALMVGFQTRLDEAPVDLDELVALALEGVERFDLDE